MLEYMQDKYSKILQAGGSHEDYLMDLYNALLTTRNGVFRDVIQRSKDAWECGADETPDKLITLATEKYNNMFKQNLWKNSNSSDSKIVALATQVKELQQKLQSATSSAHYSKSESKGDDKGGMQTTVATWRFHKNYGDSVEKDGRTWYWYMKHNNNKGLYVTHRPEDHDKRTQFFSKKNKNKESNAGS